MAKRPMRKPLDSSQPTVLQIYSGLIERLLPILRLLGDAQNSVKLSAHD
jgi:hypothetical protein